MLPDHGEKLGGLGPIFVEVRNGVESGILASDSASHNDWQGSAHSEIHSGESLIEPSPRNVLRGQELLGISPRRNCNRFRAACKP